MKKGEEIYKNLGYFMKASKKSVNRVFLRGKVAGLHVTPKESKIYLSIKDYQKKADVDGHVARNMVTVTFFGQEGKKKLEKINKYDHVEVNAIMQSVRDNKRNNWTQECWGMEIRKTPTLISAITEGEFEGEAYPEDANVVYLRGKVFNVYGHTDNWLEITVKTQVKDDNTGDLYNSSTRMTIYSQRAEKLAVELERGGVEVVVAGKLESVRKKNVKGREYNFENITVRDLKIVSAKPKHVKDPVDKVIEKVIKNGIVTEDDFNDKTGPGEKNEVSND